MTSREIAEVRTPRNTNDKCPSCGCETEKKFQGSSLGICVLDKDGNIQKIMPVWICSVCKTTKLRGDDI